MFLTGTLIFLVYDKAFLVRFIVQGWGFGSMSTLESGCFMLKPQQKAGLWWWWFMHSVAEDACWVMLEWG
jgi:hypothetical protein